MENKKRILLATSLPLCAFALGYWLLYHWYRDGSVVVPAMVALVLCAIALPWQTRPAAKAVEWAGGALALLGLAYLLLGAG